ncbi:3-hydroxybutyrate oligomer hydrolase family protein [Saccharospirillum impatiens]|uniref:3-hydroxybutyrate oligomer hydrolase family protein n=1 Tax=Saccharospirillum impatiens TaxID=169438 RepID=UPI0003F97F15|nr:3-hydroxybutyrate oligomer hydrolase family protein [Saccharospirillum impatiens]
MKTTMKGLSLIAASGLLVALGGCNDDSKSPPPDTAHPPAQNTLPAAISGTVIQRHYDGVSNDLLTAGLGADGLGSGTAPAFADAQNPTSDELRKRAIHGNYRALVPTAAGSGYGEFFGPTVGTSSTTGMIGGDEWLAQANLASGTRVTVMVQVPDGFDPDNACMVTAPSSGSRGIYGAIGTAGEWGLKRGCAVVYTDKGTGTGAHNLTDNRTQNLEGQLVSASDTDALFQADLTDQERTDFLADTPNRFAFKHAHSEQNPEASWGASVLESVRFGFYVLNELHGEQNDDNATLLTLKPDNTLVIASSVSNGGGASVLAAEQDSEGLIDGIAVSEPNVNPVASDSFSIQQGSATALTGHSRSLLDYTTALAVYQGCANLAPSIRDSAPLNDFFNDFDINENTCSALAAKGLVNGADVDARAEHALSILNDEFAFQAEQNLVQPGNYGINVPQGIAVTYANAYGQFSVADNLCGFSFSAHSANEPVPLAEAAERALFSSSNGIPPTGGVDVIYNDADGVPTQMKAATSPSSGLQDFALDGFLCLRGLATGVDPLTGDDLTGNALAQSQQVQAGIEAVRATGNLQGKPTVFVTPRNDQILPINHTSRPYVGLNKVVEGSASKLHYYEVLNAQHLDILNDFAGYNERYIPMHHYLFEALDLMYAHLSEGTDLPPSQVIRTTPRGAGAPAISAANLPDIATDPANADRIEFAASVLSIPD